MPLIQKPNVYQIVVDKLRRMDSSLPDKLANYYAKDHGIDRSFVDATDALCWYNDRGMNLSDIVSMVA